MTVAGADYRSTGATKEAPDKHANDLEVVCMADEWAKPIGTALAFFAGAIATGCAQSSIGAAGGPGLLQRGEMAGIIIVIEAIPETMTILGFVIAAIIMLV